MRRDKPWLSEHLRTIYEGDARVEVIFDRRPAAPTAMPAEVNMRRAERDDVQVHHQSPGGGEDRGRGRTVSESANARGRALRGREDADPGAEPHAAPAPVRPGLPARQTHDYRRNGLTSLYAALEVASGRVLGECRPRHTGADFLASLKRVARVYRGRALASWPPIGGLWSCEAPAFRGCATP
jgi:hypothetical protein